MVIAAESGNVAVTGMPFKIASCSFYRLGRGAAATVGIVLQTSSFQR
jgi:hypothetical protein